MNGQDTPVNPQELPEPLLPEETPFLPDPYEPESPNTTEPEPSQQPEPNTE